MRDYKFRAWDKEFDMMFYSNSSDDPLNVTGERIHHLCGCEKPVGHLNYFFFEKAPIMQFTGLHDKTLWLCFILIGLTRKLTTR